MSTAQNLSSQQVVLVTGPSGAGRATALHVLEDLGFEIIDNLPLSMLPRLLAGPPMPRPIAIGVDARTRGFSAAALQDAMAQAAGDARVQLVYLDCARDVLLRRFSETRRRHPMATKMSLHQAIDAERALMNPLRDCADILIDTTALSPHDLRAELARWFEMPDQSSLAVAVQSFSYKRGLPQGVDMVLDCRFLRNPHWDEALRPMTGRDQAVAEYVKADKKYAPFLAQVEQLCGLLLPAYRDEGKSYFTIAFGCTGGKHRSVTIAEDMRNRLAKAGWHVSIRHREIEARG